MVQIILAITRIAKLTMPKLKKLDSLETLCIERIAKSFQIPVLVHRRVRHAWYPQLPQCSTMDEIDAKLDKENPFQVLREYVYSHYNPVVSL